MPKEEKITKPKFSLGLSTIILGIILLIIPLAFFFFLNQQTERGFGFSEIFFSILFALIITSFLRWIKSLMVTRPYLSLIVGLVALIVFEYSLFFRYIGKFTIIFAAFTAIVILIYLGIHFVRNRRNAGKIREDFDDNLNPSRN